MAFDQNQIRRSLSDGLLSFPITDFDARSQFNAESYRNRLRWLKGYDVSTLFVAGGTGEFFSLAPDELDGIIETAVDVCGDSVPVVSSAGKSQREAIQHARAAEKGGADALLLMPPYLTEAPQAGLVSYIRSVCDATSLPVVVYNRANGQLSPDSVAEIAKHCDNLIGLKDGVGDVSALNTIIKTVGDRLVYVGGVPTAEIMAEAYLAIGVNTYSSAVFNFVPEQAIAFYAALREGRDEHVQRVMKEFFVPFVDLRSRCKGYAVSLIKAGAAQVGQPGGSVRAPLTMPTDDENAALGRLIDAMRQAG